MKILLITALSFLLAFAPDPHMQVAAPGQGIQFQTGTWEEALALAKREHKMVFLELYATWCGPCKQMKATGFADPEVGAVYNQSFVNITLDGERQGADLMKQHRIKAYPALLYFDADGKLLSKEIGYQSPEDLVDIAEDLIKHQKK